MSNQEYVRDLASQLYDDGAQASAFVRSEGESALTGDEVIDAAASHLGAYFSSVSQQHHRAIFENWDTLRDAFRTGYCGV